MKYFPEIFCTYSLSFSCEIKMYMKRAPQAGMSPESIYEFIYL